MAQSRFNQSCCRGAARSGAGLGDDGGDGGDGGDDDDEDDNHDDDDGTNVGIIGGRVRAWFIWGLKLIKIACFRGPRPRRQIYSSAWMSSGVEVAGWKFEMRITSIAS